MSHDLSLAFKKNTKSKQTKKLYLVEAFVNRCRGNLEMSYPKSEMALYLGMRDLLDNICDKLDTCVIQ